MPPIQELQDVVAPLRLLYGDPEPSVEGMEEFSSEERGLIQERHWGALREVLSLFSGGNVTSPSRPTASPSTAVDAVCGECRIEVLHPPEVHDYLVRHPDLASAVESVCRAARQEFGGEAELLLRVYHDPEIKDEYLTLCVRLPAYGEDFLPRLRSVSAAHEELFWDKSGGILLTTDFRPPR
jgi:hypothetical protein